MFIKSHAPSKTLAMFLAQNTAIPFVAWMIILTQKSQIEDESLFMNEEPPLLHKLRSGRKYISRPCDGGLRSKLNSNAYQVFGEFQNLNRFTIENGFTYKDIHLNKYLACIRLINFCIDWIHIILNASMKCNSYENLFTAIIRRLEFIPQEIRNIKGNSKYLTDFHELAKYIDNFALYLTCPCGWYKKDMSHCKCICCIDFEQYIYNWYTYKNDFVELRTGKLIPKPVKYNHPITVHGVYKIISS